MRKRNAVILLRKRNKNSRMKILSIILETQTLENIALIGQQSYQDLQETGRPYFSHVH